MGAARLLDCMSSGAINGRVIKGELLLWLLVWDAEIGEQVHIMCLSLIMNEITMLLLWLRMVW